MIIIKITINLSFNDCTLSNIGQHSDQSYINFQAQIMVMLTITRELLRLSSKHVVKNDCGSTKKTTECFEIQPVSRLR
jgi:hypothetical protein